MRSIEDPNAAPHVHEIDRFSMVFIAKEEKSEGISVSQTTVVRYNELISENYTTAKRCLSRLAAPKRTLPVGYQYPIKHLQNPLKRDSRLCSRFYHPDTLLREKVHQQPEVVDHTGEREMEPSDLEGF